MKKMYLFLAEGFEETEAVTTVDLLRRAGLEIETVSISKDRAVAGAHGMTVTADRIFEGTDFSDAGWLILPGGMPGTKHLGAFAPLRQLLQKQVERGGKIAAICAAPSVLGELGLLRGKRVTCYPGFEAALEGAACTGRSVETDLPFVTGNGPAAAVPFGLAIVAAELGPERAEAVQKAL